MVTLLLTFLLQALTPDNQPREPFKIADNVYYVGSSDIASYLITTSDGDILIDGGYQATAPQILANIAKLGAKPADIKILLGTQAHFDHAGGFAELKRVTHAKLLASQKDAQMLESGGRGDFYFGENDGRFPPAKVDQRIKDGEHVKVGNMTLTAHLTPGHTKGCTTWTFDATDRGRPYHVVVLCGLTVLSGTNVNGQPTYPDIKSDYQHTFATLKALPCDIFLGAHLAYYGGAAKVAKLGANHEGPNPFVDPDGYRAFIDQAEKRFRELTSAKK